MPFLIGVHSSLMEKVQGMALDDVVLLNVDTNTLETPYHDLQSLPNDVVSSLKSRLKKVSTTTGDGVARAFLKSQASLFGSYRNALQFEAGEPITFNEETFINHRSSAMRQFLQNAIQLQLFKQFIDGRLDLLNAGEGFNDIFEEEINMGEYAGSDRTYHQWLLTVKKGGGAIFQTVKTKANPAMKTVYKFAKDHAKMRIKEVKSRLKQKVCNSEQGENGFTTPRSAVDDDSTAEFAFSTAAIMREEPERTWDGHRPVTVHFGQARPPTLLKRPSSNASLESSCDQPQPYRSLKEVELIDDRGLGAESLTAPPSPVTEKFSNVNLLGDIFGCQDEPECQPITLAKSLEDLRTPKDFGELQAKFTFQRLDLSISENSRTLPGLKLSNPYNKLGSLGQEPSILPVCVPPACDRPPSVQLPVQMESCSPLCESSGIAVDSLDPSAFGNITIPRPHGRKTPELGTVLVPPTVQMRSKTSGNGEGRTTPGREEFRQALSMTSDEPQQRPPKPDEDGVDLIRLLDPLSSSAQTNLSALPDALDIMASSACKPALAPRPYPQSLPHFPPHPHISLNPFAQSLQQYSPAVSGNPFTAVYGPPLGPYIHASSQPQPFSTLPGLHRQPSPCISILPPSHGLAPSAASPSVSTLPRSSGSSHALSSLGDSACVFSTPMNTLPKPLQAQEEHQNPPDPFGDLLHMATPQKKKVEDLRRKWETFD
ncbi:PREDICTED: DENN domain-containing protein 1A-like isoform X3 [Poecilia mexicana]|uniref:DENN domain-containing protein 1A-like isoform X3 n=1 Tax=Poecilia mexicana TaxID=48701 RepID=UPI00072E37E1|nr:PREDICTED: DENN domain-containing protein 1A-like isoform X3 [Poecilia mexicana]